MRCQARHSDLLCLILAPDIELTRGALELAWYLKPLPAAKKPTTKEWLLNVFKGSLKSIGAEFAVIKPSEFLQVRARIGQDVCTELMNCAEYTELPETQYAPQDTEQRWHTDTVHIQLQGKTSKGMPEVRMKELS